ncbi:hypothetical protein Scep_011418 [Stephania cephalantha]|uniref:Uncharacterized protein n=1 Tax=Stephania cephalantha TaxID=152367 RepID=A0AAP0P8A4_9MAGN
MTLTCSCCVRCNGDSFSGFQQICEFLLRHSLLNVVSELKYVLNKLKIGSLLKHFAVNTDFLFSIFFFLSLNYGVVADLVDWTY